VIAAATSDALRRAAALIRAGEVVAFPTETVYGLGADATNAAAVARIFEIKARPSFDPLIVHVRGLDMALEVIGSLPANGRRLATRFWPGPLTLVLPKSDRIPDIVTAGLPSVAVRVPDHPVALELIERAATPIAAPSANPFGYISPTAAAHVAEQLGEHVPLILDGGPCRIGVESTILSLLGETPELLRPGGIPLEELRGLIGEVKPATGAGRSLAPGQLPRHYAPRRQLILVGAADVVPARERAAAALLLPSPDPGAQGFGHVEVLSPSGDLREAAARLFAALRRLDDGPYDRIYAVPAAESGLGRAINDRLRRAAEGRP
jgi:L-threonylcarbamoyladenylate synthase